MPVTKRNSNTTLKKTRSATPSSPKRKAKKSTSSKTSKKNFHGLVLTSAQLLQYPDLVAVDGYCSNCAEVSTNP